MNDRAQSRPPELLACMSAPSAEGLALTSNGALSSECQMPVTLPGARPTPRRAGARAVAAHSGISNRLGSRR